VGAKAHCRAASEVCGLHSFAPPAISQRVVMPSMKAVGMSPKLPARHLGLRMRRRRG